MYLKHILVLTAAALLSVSDVVSATTSPNTLQAKEAIVNDKDGKRFLRSHKETESEAEDRSLFDRKTLLKMLDEKPFRNAVFKEWDNFDVNYLKEALGVQRYYYGAVEFPTWNSMFLKYLNKYRKKANGEAVRPVKNGKSVSFAEDVQTVEIPKMDMLANMIRSWMYSMP